MAMRRNTTNNQEGAEMRSARQPIHRVDREALREAFSQYREALRIDAEERRTLVPDPPPDSVVGRI